MDGTEKGIAIAAGGTGFDSQSGRIGHSIATAVAFLCRPDAKQQRWTPSLVTRFVRNTASILKIRDFSVYLIFI